MLYIVQKGKMRTIVKAAYYINIIKKALLSINYIKTLLPLIQENTRYEDNLGGRLFARKASLEFILSREIEHILNHNGHTMAYPITSLKKEELEKGYINLNSGLDDFEGDICLSLIDGSVYTISKHIKPIIMNALIYHRVVKE